MRRSLNERAVGAAVVIGILLGYPALVLANETVLAPSTALSCLTRVAGAPAAPVYPPELFERKDGDQLEVQLEFRGRDQAPKVIFDKEYHARAFVDEIREFVSAYRVPCLSDGAAPAVLRQRFVFSPTDGRKLMPPPLSDSNDVARRAQMKCIYHTDKQARPEFPRAAAREAMEENLVVRMRFADPAAAPEVMFLSEPKKSVFRRSIEQYAQGLRMPCLTNGPNEVDTLYKFTIPGNARTLLKDMSLVQLVSGGKDYPLPAHFDMHNMACPFEVRLTYFRPYMPNRVQEIESGNPARRPLLEWMSKITLSFDQQTNLKILGHAINVTIPCGTVNLPAVTSGV